MQSNGAAVSLSRTVSDLIPLTLGDCRRKYSSSEVLGNFANMSTQRMAAVIPDFSNRIVPLRDLLEKDYFKAESTKKKVI